MCTCFQSQVTTNFTFTISFYSFFSYKWGILLCLILQIIFIVEHESLLSFSFSSSSYFRFCRQNLSKFLVAWLHSNSVKGRIIRFHFCITLFDMIVRSTDLWAYLLCFDKSCVSRFLSGKFFHGCVFISIPFSFSRRARITRGIAVSEVAYFSILLRFKYDLVQSK